MIETKVPADDLDRILELAREAVVSYRSDGHLMVSEEEIINRIQGLQPDYWPDD